MRFLLFFLTFLWVINSYSQDRTKDSILDLILKTDGDNKKAILYSKLSENYKDTKIDSAIYFANKGLSLLIIK